MINGRSIIYPPHKLPDETKNQSLATVHNIRALNTNQVHTVLLSEFNDIVIVFDGLEPGETSVGDGSFFLVVGGIVIGRLGWGAGIDRLGL